MMMLFRSVLPHTIVQNPLHYVKPAFGTDEPPGWDLERLFRDMKNASGYSSDKLSTLIEPQKIAGLEVDETRKISDKPVIIDNIPIKPKKTKKKPVDS